MWEYQGRLYSDAELGTGDLPYARRVYEDPAPHPIDLLADVPDPRARSTAGPPGGPRRRLWLFFAQNDGVPHPQVKRPHRRRRSLGKAHTGERRAGRLERL